LQAYKPAGTNIQVYAKIFNSNDSDYFDDKDWTLLQETSGNRNSSISNLADFVEYTYGFYPYPASSTVAGQAPYTGTISITSGSAGVVGTGTNFQDPTIGLKAGDLVKIYEPLFPENYIISSIASVNSSVSLTLGTAVTTQDITNLGSIGLAIDKLAYKHQAFINQVNNNTIRYFNSNMTIFDKFDTFAIKIVFLSNNQFIIPKIANIRAIGVSA
jgi:hypothetical protein